MSDGCTDKKRCSICNLLVNSPKGTIFLYLLDTYDISKTTHKIVKMLNDVVNFVGEENVVQVVSHDTLHYEAASEMLMQTHKNLYWTLCVVHCIYFILEDFEKKEEKLPPPPHIYINKTILISLLKKHT